MRNKKINNKSQLIWSQLLENYLKFSGSLHAFFQDETDRVNILRGAFERGEFHAALYVAKYMQPSELILLFDHLIILSTSHGYAGAVREIIQTLPKDWVLKNIEGAIDPLLTEGNDYDDYRRILELLIDLDSDLARKYAEKARNNPDKEIQEVGTDFLELLD